MRHRSPGTYALGLYTAPETCFPSFSSQGEGSPLYQLLSVAKPEVKLRAGERRLFSFSPTDIPSAYGQTVTGKSSSKARQPPFSFQSSEQKGGSEEQLVRVLPSHFCTVCGLKRRRNDCDPVSSQREVSDDLAQR